MTTGQQPEDSSERGFTIIELLIATTVLSVILVLVSAMMISIGRLYFKGTNQAQIQTNARSITDEVAQSLQINDQDPIPGFPLTKTYGSYTGVKAVCVGLARYTYIVGNQIGADAALLQIPHVLWRDTIPPATPCLNNANLTAAQPSTNGVELIAPKSRLTAFSIEENATTGSSPYKVTVAVVYGESDLLTPPPYNLSTRCTGEAGSQFCGTASLITTVGKRLD